MLNLKSKLTMIVQSKLVLAVGGCYLSVIYIFLDRLVIDSDRLFHSDSGCSQKLIDFILCILKKKQNILNVESEVKVDSQNLLKLSKKLIFTCFSVQVHAARAAPPPPVTGRLI